jgi:hypothetical protein
MKKLISLLSLVVACIATNTHAAIINVQPVVGGYFDFAFTPIPTPTGSQPHIVQIDVYMDVVSLGPGEDSFGTAAFSFDTHTYFGNIKPSLDAGGWAAAAHGNTDSNGPVPGGVVPLIATNADLGTDSQDYKGILVQMATGAFTNAADQRRNIGEPGSPFGHPVFLGSAYFEGEGYYLITLNPVEVSVKLTNGAFVAATATRPNVIEGPWDDPEPSSIVLATMGFVGMLLRRREA